MRVTITSVGLQSGFNVVM